MRSTAPILAGMLLPLIASCSGGGLVDPDGQAELRAAMSKWRAAGIRHYTVETRYQCFFCPVNAFVRLEVRDDTILSVALVDSLPYPVDPRRENWRTVDGMLAALERSIEKDGPPTVMYDPELGYPRSGSFYCDPDWLDCGFLFEMRNLVRLED